MFDLRLCLVVLRYFLAEICRFQSRDPSHICMNLYMGFILGMASEQVDSMETENDWVCDSGSDMDVGEALADNAGDAIDDEERVEEVVQTTEWQCVFTGSTDIPQFTLGEDYDGLPFGPIVPEHARTVNLKSPRWWFEQYWTLLRECMCFSHK